MADHIDCPTRDNSVSIVPAPDQVSRRSGISPGRLAAANISPATGLASDYLNHFHEAIMVLDMVPTMPDCVQDFVDWHPVSYFHHFAGSRLKNRHLALAAYSCADPTARVLLSELTDAMTEMLVAARDAMREPMQRRAVNLLATATAARVRPLLARASAVVNGQFDGGAVSEGSQQAAVDALLAGDDLTTPSP